MQKQLNQIDGLNEDIEKLKSEEQKLLAQIDERVEVKCQVVRDQLAKSLETIDALDKQRAASEEQIDKQKAKIQERKTANEALKAEMEKVMAADHRLKFEVTYLTNEVAALKKSIGDRNSELDKLYVENDKLKDSINYYNTEFDFT